jgi:hypothetical protein
MYHHITRDKIDSVLQEFTARQVYPEWFFFTIFFSKDRFSTIATDE